MNAEIALLSLDNPVFQTYMIAASIMILKLMFQPWMTVVRMIKAGAGFRAPEDLKKTPLNPNPEPSQLEVNEYVDRARRLVMRYAGLAIADARDSHALELVAVSA